MHMHPPLFRIDIIQSSVCIIAEIKESKHIHSDSMVMNISHSWLISEWITPHRFVIRRSNGDGIPDADELFGE